MQMCSVPAGQRVSPARHARSRPRGRGTGRGCKHRKGEPDLCVRAANIKRWNIAGRKLLRYMCSGDVCSCDEVENGCSGGRKRGSWTGA